MNICAILFGRAFRLCDVLPLSTSKDQDTPVSGMLCTISVLVNKRCSMVMCVPDVEQNVHPPESKLRNSQNGLGVFLSQNIFHYIYFLDSNNSCVLGAQHPRPKFERVLRTHCRPNVSKLR